MNRGGLVRLKPDATAPGADRCSVRLQADRCSVRLQADREVKPFLESAPAVVGRRTPPPLDLEGLVELEPASVHLLRRGELFVTFGAAGVGDDDLVSRALGSGAHFALHCL